MGGLREVATCLQIQRPRTRAFMNAMDIWLVTPSQTTPTHMHCLKMFMANHSEP